MQSLAVERSELVTAELIAKVTQARIDNPELAVRLSHSRQRPKSLTNNGRLVVIAADHPARRVVQTGDNPLAMADRADFLRRIANVLLSGFADGVMGTMDVLEDLLVLDDLCRETDRQFLQNKVLIASGNRGGLSGTAWELDDPVTSATAQSCHEFRLDGLKLLLRICDGERDSLKTIQYCADQINQANSMKLPVFLEPLPVERTFAGYKVVKDYQQIAKTVGVASALGNSSRYLWLKLPYCEDFGRVAAATTLPILLLGGESGADVAELVAKLDAGLCAGSNVRGMMIGRNVLYPAEQDPVEVAEKVYKAVHSTTA